MSDAWRYATKLDDPEAVRLLLQAALGAFHTVTFAQRKVNPEQFGTVPDWEKVRLDLQAALKAAGHPAGDWTPGAEYDMR